MTIPQDRRNELIKYRMEQAQQAVADTELLIVHKRYNVAINRIYYCIFYILSALALKNEFETSKHLQLMGWFNKNFVKEGIVSSDVAGIVHKAYIKRTKSDYSVFVEFNIEEVKEMLLELKEFIK